MCFRWLFTWQLCLQKKYLNGGLWSRSSPWLNFVWVPNQDPRNLLSPETVHETTCFSAQGVSGVAGVCPPPSAAGMVKGATHGFHFQLLRVNISKSSPSLHREEHRGGFFTKPKGSGFGKTMPGAGHLGKTARSVVPMETELSVLGPYWRWGWDGDTQRPSR